MYRKIHWRERAENQTVVRVDWRVHTVTRWWWITAGDDQIQRMAALVCWACDVLYHVKGIQNLEQVVSVSVIRVVDVDVEIAWDDNLALKGSNYFEERGNFIKEFVRYLFTSGSVDHHFSVDDWRRT